MEYPELYTFIEDLVWCPSQIYYYFISKNQNFCIYLRWRHSDPWTAELVKCDENWEFTHNDWKKIKLNKDYKDCEYKELELDVLNNIKNLFPNIDFPDNSIDITYYPTKEDIEKTLNILQQLQKP